MKKIWVVVANSSFSKFLRAEDTHTLVEHHQIEHPESQMKASELVSDNRGRSHQRMGYFADTMQEPTSLKRKEAQIFAAQISKYLESAFNEGKIDKIYLIAKPPFLGFIREALAAPVAGIIESEIQKDLTLMSPKEIREYLPLVL